MPRPIDILSPLEVRQLINACGRRSPTGKRNAALVTLLYRAGLRISEALALHPRDLNANRGTIRVHRGKGDKARTVSADPEAFAIFAVWIRERQRLTLPAAAPFFCTLKGATLKRPYVHAMLKRLASRAGIDKRVHAHGFRHTHATELVSEGVALPTIQKQLGHSSLATTSVYVDHLGAKEVLELGKHRTWKD